MKEFGVDPLNKTTSWVNVIFQQQSNNECTEFWCFPYNIPPYTRPYPGFEVLESWLETNIPTANFVRHLSDGRSMLVVKIYNLEDALIFSLMSEHLAYND